MPGDRTTARATWHAGEIAMQQRAGVADALAALGPRLVRDHLIEQHRAFFPLLEMIVLGTVDDAGDAWATVRAGTRSFVHAVDDGMLAVTTAHDPGDPASSGLAEGAAVGVLGIDLSTRRRNRVNGIVTQAKSDGFELRVAESFGNCPKYIHLRDVVTRDDAEPRGPVRDRIGLDGDAADFVRNADTFFVASYVDGPDGRRVDVSHRGGRPGFVRVADDGTMTIPDFAGNRFFNTLGNILVNGRAGLTFVDFAGGHLLQLSGDAAIRAGDASLVGHAGAERVWSFEPRRSVYRGGALGLRLALRSADSM